MLTGIGRSVTIDELRKDYAVESAHAANATNPKKTFTLPYALGEQAVVHQVGRTGLVIGVAFRARGEPQVQLEHADDRLNLVQKWYDIESLMTVDEYKRMTAGSV